MTTILVVDDDPPIVEMLASVLDDAGYTVYCAFGGRQGFTMAIQLRPDLVLSDVHMPDVSGEVLCQRLRQQGWQQPIILMSATHTAIDLIHCTPTAFLAKPFDFDRLVATIQWALSTA